MSNTNNIYVTKDDFFARNVRGGLAQPGQNVHWVALHMADQYTSAQVARIQRQHPDAVVVTEEEAREIERARQQAEGIEEQWASAHGF